MRRRDLLVGAAAMAASPVLGQEAPLPVIGFLNSQSPVAFAHLVAAFQAGLGQRGYVEGVNVAIEYRWAEGQYDRLPALAADLVERGVTVIFAAGGNPAGLAAHAATTTIPIVFNMGGDPVALGLVASLNRPGGNLTGYMGSTGGLDQKRMELLHELLPSVGRLTVLVNPTFANEGTDLGVLEEAAAVLGLELDIRTANTAEEISAAFAAMANEGVEALLIGTDPFFYSQREDVVALASRYAIPTMYTQREYVTAGGLLSYSTSLASAYEQLGVYVARILDGEKAAEMPILQDTVFDFVINLRTADALGIDVPVTLLAVATEIIE